MAHEARTRHHRVRLAVTVLHGLAESSVLAMSSLPKDRLVAFRCCGAGGVQQRRGRRCPKQPTNSSLPKMWGEGVGRLVRPRRSHIEKGERMKHAPSKKRKMLKMLGVAPFQFLTSWPISEVVGGRGHRASVAIHASRESPRRVWGVRTAPV
jgi:hypothetical protein